MLFALAAKSTPQAQNRELHAQRWKRPFVRGAAFFEQGLDVRAKRPFARLISIIWGFM
jgi:hypothetical protein